MLLPTANQHLPHGVQKVMADSDTTEAAQCEHGFGFPVVCPRCEPGAYECARPQVERWLKKRFDEGRPRLLQSKNNPP